MSGDRPSYSLKAPGRSGTGSALHLPGRGAFPGIDERMVEPETREEIIGGRRIVTSPALEPHAAEHGEVSAVLRFHAAPGYGTAVDMLTRYDVESDFASDACLYKSGIDPATGGRHLEEIAFEVVSAQNESVVREKAVRMHRRGVRRIFAVFVKGEPRVCEWEPDSRSWRPLERTAAIADPCLARPLPVVALFDAMEADNAVVEVLRAKNNPALRRVEADSEQKGLQEGRREGEAGFLLRLLEKKFGALEAGARERIGTAAPSLLQEWFDRALTATSLRDVFGPGPAES